MMLRRARFAAVIDAQLELFLRENSHVLTDVAQRLERYNAADRDEAEELYGDYVDAVETGTEILADMRDHYAVSLDEPESDRFIAEFNRAVTKRLPQYAVEIENR
jgi:bisphosphoglycerate-independent phosphoglycerate mutase (AlkP superfamily)